MNDRVAARGHWTYSLNRHIGLLEAFMHEKAALRALGPAATARHFARGDTSVAAAVLAGLSQAGVEAAAHRTNPGST